MSMKYTVWVVMVVAVCCKAAQEEEPIRGMVWRMCAYAQPGDRHAHQEELTLPPRVAPPLPAERGLCVNRDMFWCEMFALVMVGVVVLTTVVGASVLLLLYAGGVI